MTLTASSTPDQISDDIGEAIAYAMNYTGTFGLVRDIQTRIKRYPRYGLTAKQVNALLASKAREEAWAAERAAAAAAAPVITAPVPKLPEGRRYYAIENADGNITFLRITRTKYDYTYIDQVIGGRDAESRGRVLPNGQYFGTFEALYRKVTEDPEAAMRRYGHEIGRCGYCGRTLTDPESRYLGIGPVCRQKGFGA
jgi:hypothetical protein